MEKSLPPNGGTGQLVPVEKWILGTIVGTLTNKANFSCILGVRRMLARDVVQAREMLARMLSFLCAVDRRRLGQFKPVPRHV
jgi:hypothetical protein